MGESLKFPTGFLWGTSTSAYQVEGGIENNDWSKAYPAGLACDHYHRFQDDFNLMKKLNQNAYRFSIEWSRIEPEEGRFNKKEIEHYLKVSQSLKSRGIKIMVTLHHFTLPVWLTKIGGFSNKKSIFYFSRFAKKIFLEYKNLVDFWIIFNEPLIYSSKGYLEGDWPSKKKGKILFLKVLRNQISAHKKIYQDFHNIKTDARVGIAKNNIYFEPANRRSLLDKSSVFLAGYFWNEYFLNRIKNHLDFIGLNYYFHNKIKFPWLMRNDNKILSDIGWEIYPEGIYYVLKKLQKYNLPIYITENGLADAKDKLRANFIKDHLFWIHRAIKEGIDARGYFHWSLMDNFEWEKGFGPRFGLVEIDYKTFERKPRNSAFYYAKICKNNSILL